ncbi:MAG: c-type cytochrome biogenesis protein CcmI, partial [Burkholderiaceae bacterium]|nr:c-type cytochrome biogenesis protein CcmI [Burkholderiaceae bacterium]
MALFWAIAAALLLLAMWMVAGALWRKPAQARTAPSAGQSNLAVLKAQLSQADADLAEGRIDATLHQATRAEIERRVLEEESVAAAPVRDGSPRATMILLLVAVPVLALGLYGLIGNPAALSPQPVSAQGEPSPQEVQAMVAKLAERMEKQPPGNVADTEGWVMLGRSYAVMQRYPEASRAFARALQLMPNDAQILVDQADVLAMQQGGNLQGEPLRLIEQALQNNPSNLKGLALAGTAAFERKDYAGAIGYWSRARAAAPPEGEFRRSLEQSLADARAAAGDSVAPAAPVAAAASAAAPKAPGAASISGRVSLAPALAARVGPGDTLFVFARAAEGPRMPLAILKRTGADLPLSFTLDDGMAMAP